MLKEMAKLGFEYIELSHGIRITLVPGILRGVEEGSKPVQRRIVWGMFDAGARANTQYRKSAGIVGDVLTDEAYAKLHAANKTLMAGCERVIAEYGLPAHTVGMGSKGCIVFASEPVREYREYCTKIHHDLTDLAWLYHMNNGIFMTPGQDEQWTLSVLHSDADLARYVEVFETFARDVTGASGT